MQHVANCALSASQVACAESDAYPQCSGMSPQKSYCLRPALNAALPVRMS
jgi:hypothetical protein